MEDHSVKIISVFMKIIITELIPDPEESKYTACDSHRESGYIYEGKSFVSFEIPDGDLEIIF